MELNYFGTDGIRGRAYAPPLTLEEVARWGQAWAQVARARGIEELVIGWDPRLSSEPMARAFAAGLDGQLRLCVLGLVPTPAVAHAASTRPRAWGLVLSASHNPPEDNGIKGFDGKGEKISEEDEAALEAVFDSLPGRAAAPLELPFQKAVADAYMAHLGGIDLPDGLKLVVDCAHGATAPWAPLLFRGKDVHWLGSRPTAPGSTWGSAPPTWSSWRPKSPRWARPPASPSTATATAASWWTARAPWWTATSWSGCWPRTCTAAAGPCRGWWARS